jgi:hypothetical protein
VVVPEFGRFFDSTEMLGYRITLSLTTCHMHCVLVYPTPPGSVSEDVLDILARMKMTRALFAPFLSSRALFAYLFLQPQIQQSFGGYAPLAGYLGDLG